MKSQRIPEHKMNFTSEVAQTLENTDTNNANLKKETATNRNNSKMNK